MGEPIETRLPWARRPVRRLTQQRIDHARLHPIAGPNPHPGEVQQYSVITADYEPNRPMAPDPTSIIAKKGLRPKDIHTEPTTGDKIVVWTVVVCLTLMALVIGYAFITMG